MAEMASLAKQFNAETTLVSLAQSLRVVLIVLSIPPIMAIATGTVAIPHQPVPLIAPAPLIVGLVIAIAASVMLAALRLFNPWLIGGLLAGISTALFLGAASKVPQGLTIAAQIAIGTALGARFRRVALIQAARSSFLPATLLSTAGLICVNIIIAAGISFFVPFLTGVLATSPGGIAEMSLTAEALSLAPPLVAAWQLCRILSVALLTGPLYALYSRLP
jgi:membrane AbrB-like protein